MKKLLKITLIFLFLCLFGYLSFQIFQIVRYKNEIAENIKVIPDFDYLNIKGGHFTKENLKKHIPTLFIYFNSDCEFCNEETKMIQENRNFFNGVQLIFVSFEPAEAIKNFAIKYQLSNHDNIHFLCDNNVTFATTFDVKSLPCLVLYDKNQKLIEKIKGQTKPETLVKKLGI